MHKFISNYNNFLNESSIEKYTDLFLTDYNNPEKVTEILMKIKDDILSRLDTISKDDIKKMIHSIANKIDNKVISMLDLDSFFKGLSNIILLKNKKKIEKYFNDYIKDLPRRVEQYSDVEEYEEDELPEFEELKKIKKKIKFKIDKKTFNSELIPLKIELLKMQEWLKKTKQSLVICFDGRDAAGKGSGISTMSEDLNPKYYTISVFDIPTEEEQKNWFDRYKKRLPKPGKITFYDRSWWNRGCNDIVMEYCTNEQYEQFMKDVIVFEDNIVKNNTYLIKFWFSVSKEIQQLRFEMRQKDPLHYWKFSENDLKTMSKWDKFTLYKERMFYQSSKTQNPFIIVISDDKRLAQLNAIRYILKQVPYDNKNLKVVDKIRPEIIIPFLDI